MMNVMRRKYVRPLLGAGLLVSAIALAFFVSSLSQGVHSVEVGVAEHSPLGLSGGVVVPASCPSYAHNGGNCTANVCTADLNYDVDTGECLPIFCQTGQVLSNHVCTPPDVCPNIDGLQTSVPAGYTTDGSGNCVSSTPADVCPNIAGAQATVPSGYTVDGSGNCVVIPPTDVCGNVPGNQASVPSGYDQSGSNCYPSSPSGLSGSCSAVSNYQAILGWQNSPISGATYNVRMDALNNGWTGTCPTTNAGDLCLNGQANSNNSYVMSSAGVSYDAWVHVCDANGICTPSPIHTSFSCPAAPVTQQPPVCSSFTASASSITSGSSATLTWNSTGANSALITASVGNSAPGSVSVSGSASVTPPQTTTYNLALTNAAGTTNCAPVTVTVTAPPGPTMSCSATSVVAGGTITATVTGGVAADWVGEYNAGASDYSYLVGYNPPLPRPSTVTFTPPTTPGTYQLRLWPSGLSATTNSCTFTVTAAPVQTSSISVTKSGAAVSGVTASWGSSSASAVPVTFTNVTIPSNNTQSVYFSNVSGYTVTVGSCANSTGNCSPLSYASPTTCTATQCTVSVPVTAGQVTHVDLQYAAIPSCTPASPSTETQLVSCPTGQTGSITQTRTSTCASGATSPTWSAWTTTSNTCVAQTCPAGYGGTYPNCTCPSGYTGTYPSCTPPATTGSINVTSSGASGAQVAYNTNDTASWGYIPRSYTNVTPTSSGWIYFTNFSNYSPMIGVCTNATGNCTPTYSAPSCSGTQCYTTIPVYAGQTTKVDIIYTQATVSCPTSSVNAGSNFTVTVNGGNSTGDQVQLYSSGGAMYASANPSSSRPATVTFGAPSTAGVYTVKYYLYGASVMADSCTVNVVSNPTCTIDPTSPQTQNIACPTGQTGTITQQRTSSCPAGASSPVWSAWTTTSSNCTTTQSCPAGYGGTYPNCTCPSGYTGTYPNCIAPSNATVSCPTGTLTTGGSFSVTVTGGSSTSDWLGVYATSNGFAYGGTWASAYATLPRPATVNLTTPSAAGTYQVQLWPQNASSAASSCNITVADPVGSISITQSGGSASAPQAAVDSNQTSYWGYIPKTVSNLSVTSHIVYFTNISGYSATVGTCTNSSGSCTPTSYAAATCSGSQCWIYATVTAGQTTRVDVQYAQTPPSCSGFTASTGTISYGGSSTLNWSSSGGTTASITASAGTSPGSVATSGSLVVSPTTTTVYSLSVTNAGGTTACGSVTVNVTGSAPGTISVTRSGASGTAVYSALDSSSSTWFTIPSTFTSASAGAHTVFFTNLSGYTATVGTCTNSTGSCTPNSYAAATCSGTQCWVAAPVTSAQTTRVDVQYTATASCTPDPTSPQTQTVACPSGQTGSITQQRTSTCASGATSPTWGLWTDVTNTCVASGSAGISVTRSGAAGTSVYAALDSNSSTWYTIPKTFSSLTAGTHLIYFTNLSGYSATVGTCSNSTGSCTPLSYAAATCSGTQCWVYASPGSSQITRVDIQYTAAVVPTCTISANPTSMNAGSYTTLTWTSTNAVVALMTPNQNGSGTQSVATNGSAAFTSNLSSGTQTYSMTVTSSDNSTGTCSVDVPVTPAGGSPSVACSASTVAPGGTISGTITGGTSAYDWVSVYAASDTNNYNYGATGATPSYSFANTTTRPTTVSFTAPTTPGSYELRVFPNGGVTSNPNTCPFTVSSGSSGSISVTQSGANQTVYSALDSSGSTWYTIPKTFSGTSGGSHWIFFTNISSYTASVGTCTNASGSCTPSSYTAASCSGSLCWAQASVTSGQVTKFDVQYAAASGPMSCSISANPSSITVGDSSLLSWSCSGTGTCSISPTVGSVPCSSGSVSVSPTQTTTYTLTATNASGSSNYPATVNVVSPVLNINSSAVRVHSGDSVSITWSATNANSCSVTGPGGTVLGSGTSGGPVSSGPVSTRSVFTLTCTPTGGGAPVSASITVSLIPIGTEI